jgi:pimeloyl-ACP methyl ester carboxylesterase
MAILQRPGAVDLAYEERGEGPLVMLAPYWSGHPDVYAGFLSDLQLDHRIVTWDARGTGGSTRTGPYDINTDSDDLEAMLEHVGPAAAVIGVGNGCNILVHVAARRPDLIGAVLAFGAGPFARMDFAGSEAMIASDSVVAAFLEMLQRDYRGALRTMLTATNPQMSEDELRDRVDFQTGYCPQEAAIARVRAWAEDDPTEATAAIGDRLWIFSSQAVAGTWLPSLEERQRIIRRIAPDAHVEETADDAGPVSRPDLIAALIRRVTESTRLEAER